VMDTTKLSPVWTLLLVLVLHVDNYRTALTLMTADQSAVKDGPRRQDQWALMSSIQGSSIGLAVTVIWKGPTIPRNWMRAKSELFDRRIKQYVWYKCTHSLVYVYSWRQKRISLMLRLAIAYPCTHFNEVNGHPWNCWFSSMKALFITYFWKGNIVRR